MITSQLSTKFYKRMYLALGASGGLTAINAIRLLKTNHADSILLFSAVVWFSVFIIFGILIWRWKKIIPIELSNTTITSRLGMLTKVIKLTDISMIKYDNGVYRLINSHDKVIASFGDNEYNDLSFLRNLPQFHETSNKPTTPGKSMKKLFVITFAIAFGAVAALLTVAITLVATGTVKRSIFGGYSFSFEDSNAESSTSDYDRKSAIAKGLIVKNASVVDGDDERMKKIICEITNPNEDLTEDLVAFDVLLVKQGKVIKILSTFDSISLKKGETRRIIMTLITKEKLEFDSIEMIAKG